MPPYSYSNNGDLEKELDELPDEVAAFLITFRTATLDRERAEALAYLKYRGEDKERTSTEIKALVHSNEERYQAVLREIQAEAQYTRILEKLLCAKKKASLRTAY